MQEEREALRILAKKTKLETSSIKEVAQEIHKNAVAHGWWETQREVPELIALCHSELSEALEEYRNGKVKPIYYNGNNAKPEGIGIELADVIIRVFDMCEGLGIDIQAAIAEKMSYNETRPYRHGGKKA